MLVQRAILDFDLRRGKGKREPQQSKGGNPAKIDGLHLNLHLSDGSCVGFSGPILYRGCLHADRILSTLD